MEEELRPSKESPSTSMSPQLDVGSIDARNSQGFIVGNTGTINQKFDLGPSPEQIATIVTTTITELTRERSGIGTFTDATNIPAQPNQLIGRQHECRAVESLFRQDGVRLVTIFGSGGIGKTRLALEVANKLRSLFANGAFFVDLANTNEPELVISAIALTLGVEESGSQAVIEDLSQFLHNRELLLVLDNFEQVTSAADMLAKLLADAPKLKLLVTSRKLLNIEAERVFPLEPLMVPPANEVMELDVLAEFPAVKLFIERAQDTQPSFALTNENAKPVTEVCRRLGGLPLALVLAAARLKLFTPQQVLDKLTAPLDALKSGARDLPMRQRTLRATIAWSFDLLDEPAQSLFAQIGIFVGGASLSAIEDVCIIEVESADEQLLLEQLLDSSLVQRYDTISGEPRFSMLAMLRDYALEVIAQRGQTPSLRQRHADHFLRFVEQADLVGAEQSAWLSRLEVEHDNLREAVSWNLGQVNPEAALRFGAILARFWRLRGYRTEGRYWLNAILDKRLRVPAEYAEFEPEQINRLKLATAATLNGTAYLLTEQNDYAQAVPLYYESLALYQQLNDDSGAAFVQMNLGIVALDQLNYTEAQSQFEASLALARSAGDLRIVACDLNNLGIVAQEQNDVIRAESLYSESLQLTRKLGLTHISAMNVANLGLIAYSKGDDERAQAMYSESLALNRDLRNESGIAHALTNLGWVLLRQERLTDAEERFADAYKRFINLGEPRNIAECMEGQAGVAVARGEYERAAKLCSAADVIRVEHQVLRPPDEEERYRQIIQLLRKVNKART